MQNLSIWLLLILIELPSLYFYTKYKNIDLLLFSVLPIVCLWALFKNSRYLLLLYPFALIVPLNLFYIYFYDTSINEQILSIILESNLEETKSYLGSNVYFYITLLIVWIVGITFLFWQNHKYYISWTHRSRWWVLITTSSFLCIIVAANYEMSLQFKGEFISDSSEFLAEDKSEISEKLKKTYPLGILVTVFDLYQEQIKINSAFNKNKNFSFNANTVSDKGSRQLIVLVIGETSRRANWQLNGYSRETNPHLAKQENLVNFIDMIGVSSATRSSIPMLLTRKPAKQVYRYEFPEKSVISAFKEAGFETYWLSTQQKFGAYDTSTSVYAKEADNVIFLNKANYSNRGDTDEVILPILSNVLKTRSKKIFIVIHTLGSHFDYSDRYPESYDIFSPSLNNLDNYSLQDQKYKQEFINSYDNSVVYTDYVLNSMIEKLQTQSNTESFLLFSSDHGEDLFDNSCDKSGHGNETAYNFEIASFAWYSDSFAVNNADKIQHLQSNQNKKINQTSIFPTLIDAADINIPNYKRERSLLNEFNPYQRLVMGYKDYDRSPPQGVCREIK